MIIKIQKGRKAKTEHGYSTYEELKEYSPCKHCFNVNIKKLECGCNECLNPDPKHIVTIPFKKHIHPCNKGKIKCYKGNFYNTNKNNYLNPCDTC